MNENQRYEIIKKVIETNGNKKTAALKIGCSERHINRLIKGYKDEGKAFLFMVIVGESPQQLLNQTKEGSYWTCIKTNTLTVTLPIIQSFLKKMRA